MHNVGFSKTTSFTERTFQIFITSIGLVLVLFDRKWKERDRREKEGSKLESKSKQTLLECPHSS